MIVEELVLIEISAAFIEHGVEPTLPALHDALGNPDLIQRTIQDPHVDDDAKGILKSSWDETAFAWGELYWIRLAWLLQTFQKPEFYARGQQIITAAQRHAQKYRKVFPV
jgi:hypothetical protein